MRIRRATLVWLAAGAVLIAGLAAWLRPEAVVVEAGVVARGPIRVTVAEEGQTRLRRRFAISAPVAGRVLRIDAVPGDPVTRDQVLATITPAPPTPLDVRTRQGAEARVRTAQAALDQAVSERARVAVEAEQAAREAARLEKLLAAGSISRETLEVAVTRRRSTEAAVETAAAGVRAAEFTLAEARAALASDADRGGGRAVSVRSPVDGVVLRRVQESEAVVAPGAPLLEVGDLRDLEIVADLLSSDGVAVRAGAEVIIDRWGGDRPLRGRVRRVEPAAFTKISALGVEEQRVNVVVDFVDPVEVRPRLGDGFRVEVEIVTDERSGVLTVPTSSLVRADGRWSVFVLTGEQVARRPVTVGLQNDRLAEVTDGLAEGDRVVLYPGESLVDGARVVVRDRPAAAGG